MIHSCAYKPCFVTLNGRCGTNKINAIPAHLCQQLVQPSNLRVDQRPIWWPSGAPHCCTSPISARWPGDPQTLPPRNNRTPTPHTNPLAPASPTPACSPPLPRSPLPRHQRASPPPLPPHARRSHPRWLAPLQPM
jgi:hypothetical protein